MEKIKVIEINTKWTKGTEEKAPVQFWGCKLSDGRIATVWDSDIADTIKANLNVECDAEVKTQGSFTNIRAFVASTAQPIVKEEIKPVQATGMSTKDIQIIAQCMVKCVAYQTPMTLNKALELFHEAVLSLEQNG